jgi:aminopeptidase N
MFACFEQPDLKATYALTVTAPADWQVVSNSPTPEPTRDSDGNGKWVFEPTPRMSTYIVALIAGAYHVERDAYDGPNGTVPLGVFCRQSLQPYLDASEIFAVTKQGFAFFETLFDYPYPFAKYDQLFVPEYNMGAMENAGAVTIRDEYVFRSRETDAEYGRRAETILHELAHMWFGDLVTMRWWDDLWLNESFATYASVLCQAEVTQWTNAWTTFANTEKAWAYNQDQLPSTHPIAADIRDLEDVEVNFDGITYAKGASVLKQLVAWVGQDEFFEGLRRYFKRHEWSNTSLEDLLRCLTETSGRDLQAWSREWLETAGVATLRPEIEVGDDGAYRSFAVLQEAPESHPTLRSHRLAIGLYDRTTTGLQRRRRVEIDVAGARTEVAELVGEPQPDVVLINDDDLAFAKIRLDERSLRTMIDAIAEFDDSLPRALCWSAAWDMCRDAEFAARDFVDLVLGGVGAEGDITVSRMLVRAAQTAVDLYSAPDDRRQIRQRWADGLLGLVRSAEPGSDAQVNFARAFAAAAAAPEHATVLSGWLAGDDVPEKLAVDTDLRWQFVQRLAALGAIGEDEITAEQDRDDTITGREMAAHARAALPDADAKATAWDVAVHQPDTTNGVQYQTIVGFLQPGQEELQEPYAEAYFRDVNDVWTRMTHEMAQNVVHGLYPRYLTSQATLDRTDAWIAEVDPPPALRRLVVENRDRIERALRCQARDAAATR